MFGFLKGAADRQPFQLPLFLLKTVLFPGGVLPLKVFEQRYIEMAKACLSDGQPFGVCLITHGEEVATGAAGAPQFASIGTLATIGAWDMPQLGILHISATGGGRFQVRSHAVRADGLVVAEATPIPAEPAVALADAYAPLARLLQLLASRVASRQFPEAHAFDDASWVGYRLAELLPLPLSIKQGMLEINDSDVRLSLLRKFLEQQGLLANL
jgi:Lon protease-like protein